MRVAVKKNITKNVFSTATPKMTLRIQRVFPSDHMSYNCHHINYINMRNIYEQKHSMITSPLCGEVIGQKANSTSVCNYLQHMCIVNIPTCARFLFPFPFVLGIIYVSPDMRFTTNGAALESLALETCFGCFFPPFQLSSDCWTLLCISEISFFSCLRQSNSSLSLSE